MTVTLIKKRPLKYQARQSQSFGFGKTRAEAVQNCMRMLIKKYI